MKLLNDIIIDFFRRLRIFLQYVQNVKVSGFLVDKEKHQNINVDTVATNLMILKLRCRIKRKNKKVTIVDNTLTLMNKYLLGFLLFNY